MNNWDRTTLSTFLQMDNLAFAKWCEGASDQEFEYVVSLLDKAQNEIDMQLSAEKPIEDLSMAKAVLGKFTLTGEMQ